MVGHFARVGERVRIKSVLNEDQIHGQHGKQKLRHFQKKKGANSEINFNPSPKGKKLMSASITVTIFSARCFAYPQA